ncbi:hypothetical protein M878_07485 [Streptomyces roseochromogenus subsp. oscitans DS 12.976]|uniref:Uncharacterized protein n=1 Tax=Streptomyces roseochromogenus subsp. oscitans DS 12.976 TaxID=1352936 RepID=V6KSQ8_STRRC|nr:hypothetical protein M878_07485 [Streptomyces roseochromogenus subsp. oscitans DS 12.976]
MLLRLAHLAATNARSLLRLLPTSDRDKDIEILACGTNCSYCNARPNRCSPATSSRPAP